MSTQTLSWLDDLRARGRARFSETGLPSRKDEAWKFTGVNKLHALGLEPTPSPSRPLRAGPHPLPAGARDRKFPHPNGERVPAKPVGEGAHRLAFVDGRLRAELSDVGKLPEGVILGRLADQIDDIQPHLGKLIDIDRRPMAALNTAWIEDGLVLIVPDGVVLDRPIEVSFAGGSGTVHPRHLIVLGRAAEAVLIERHVAEGGFANSVTEIALGAGSNLRHYALHEETEAALATTTIVASIGRDATYQTFALTAGGGLVRREIEARLEGQGASCRIDGAYLVGGQRRADTTVLVDHKAPHCSSRQTQKGIVDDQGHAVFQGKVLVRPGAQKTDASQSSQTLLLSPGAEIDVKPELEIHADDVKCSHGATSGRLDAGALFYLRSRGIPEGEARALLIQGFIDGALDEIDHEAVRESFKAAAANWLAKRVTS